MKIEIIINAIIFCFGGYLYYLATKLPEIKIADRVGPSFWPKIILFFIIILSGFLLTKNIIIILKRKSPPKIEVLYLQKDWNIRLVLAILLSIIYAFFVSYIGFLISIFLFQLILLIILKVKKVLVLFFFPFIMTVIFYLIFIRTLHMPLPRGMGIFITLSRFFY